MCIYNYKIFFTQSSDEILSREEGKGFPKNFSDKIEFRKIHDLADVDVTVGQHLLAVTGHLKTSGISSFLTRAVNVWNRVARLFFVQT
jgi:hypothetical protein